MYKFDCGCEVPIIDATIKPEDGLPSLEIDWNNINHNCPAVWELYAKGNTKGVFQLEKPLGQSWAKKVQPTSVEEISALIALIRPGVLKGLIDGKSMANHYVDRKHGEDYELFHNDAESAIGKTYGVMLYQEQTLAISKIFAGFNLAQADILRRGMGKKKADVMAALRSEFVDGCRKTGIINEHDASALFDVIEKSNRYSFNKSHSVCYAETGYWCAWAKCHFPMHFFCSWLSYANEKQKPRDEIQELMLDARGMDIRILSPSIFKGNEYFQIEKDSIRFGLGYIKDIGPSKLEKLLLGIAESEKSLGKKVSDMSWFETLCYVIPNAWPSVVSNLIAVGAMSNYGLSRKQMLFEHEKFSKLTDRELAIVRKSGVQSVVESFKLLLSEVNSKRKLVIENYLKILENPPEELKDNEMYIASVESQLLGCSITCSKLDSRKSNALHTVKDFNTKNIQNYLIAVEINSIREWSPPNSTEKLAFLSASDKTGRIDITVPSNVYSDNEFLFFPGNTVMIEGYKSKKGSLGVKKVTQI